MNCVKLDLDALFAYNVGNYHQYRTGALDHQNLNSVNWIYIYKISNLCYKNLVFV